MGQGKVLMDDTIAQLLNKNMPIGTFYKEDVLNNIVYNELKTSIESIKSSLTISAEIVNQWAGANMPRLGSTMQHFLNRLQGIRSEEGLYSSCESASINEMDNDNYCDR